MFQPNLFSDRQLQPRPIRPPRPKAPRAHGRVNWLSRSTARTIDIQDQIVAALAHADEGFTVRELAGEIGVSRQAALYHVKKAVAAGRIVMVLEPCPANAGLQFRVWDQTELARKFARTLPMAERVDLFMRASHAA